MGVTRRYDLVARMRDLGVKTPKGWAQSELQRDIPQEARWLILLRIWAECIDGWTADNLRGPGRSGRGRRRDSACRRGPRDAGGGI
jgi:hypothetical protein